MSSIDQPRVVLLITVVLGLSAVSLPVAAAPPDIQVRANGTTLSNGGTVTVTENPTIAVDVSADSKINTVSVRVNGEPRRSFSPGSTSFSKKFTLDVENGAHDLTIVASAGETTTHSGTLKKDTIGPRVAFSSPFSTSRLAAPSDTEVVAHGNVTLAGTVDDLSGVKRITLRRVYTYKFAGQTRTDRNTYSIDNPGESFSQPLILGPGDNQMKMTLTDEHGHSRVHQWTIRVDDRTKPQIKITSVRRASEGTEVRINGTVSDDTKVKSLTYTTQSGSSKSILAQTTKQPTRSGLSSEFSFTAKAGPNVNTITLTATDTAGNTLTRDVSLNFEERVEPVISFDKQATTITDGTVHVVGSVTEGRVTKVTVETVGPDGSVISLVTVHSGDSTQTVTIDERLEAAGSDTRVIIRAVDTLDRRHKRTLSVTNTGSSSGSGGSSGSDGSAGGAGTDGATATAGSSGSQSTRTAAVDDTPPATESSSPGFGVTIAIAALVAATLLAMQAE